MKISQRLQSIFSRAADTSDTTPTFIHPRVPVFPNDGEDPLLFPPVLDTPEKKVIYALHARGQQPYEYLCLETQIPPHVLDPALTGLVNRGAVTKRFLGPKASLLHSRDDPEWKPDDACVFTMYSIS